MSSVAYFNTRSVGAHHIIMQMHLLGSQRDAWHLLNQFYMERLLHSIGWEKDKLLNYWCVASCYKSRPGTLHIKGPCLEDRDLGGQFSLKGRLLPEKRSNNFSL